MVYYTQYELDLLPWLPNLNLRGKGDFYVIVTLDLTFTPGDR